MSWRAACGAATATASASGRPRRGRHADGAPIARAHDREHGVDDPPVLPYRRARRSAAGDPHWLLRTALCMAVLRSADARLLSEPNDPAAPPAHPFHRAAVPPVGLHADVCRDANWHRLSENEKVGRALACVTASTDAALKDAIGHIRDCRQWVITSWRDGGGSAARANAWRAADGRTRETLRALTGLAMFVDAAPDASRAQVDARARALLAEGREAGHEAGREAAEEAAEEARGRPEDVEALYARQLLLDTDDWLSIDALHRRTLSPVDLLGQTYRWCGSKLSDVLTPAYLPRGALDRCGVELAAMLDARVAGDVPTLASVTGIDPLVSVFEQDLRRDVCLRWWGRALLPASATPRGLAPVWFDGGALHGATGMDFHALVAHLARRHDALTAALSEAYVAAPDHCRALANLTLEDIVLDRLRVVAESTDYPFGTPYQSLATVLLRLGPLHGLDASHIDEPDRLFERYEALEAAWAEAPRYPVAPHIAAAFHLARSSEGGMHDVLAEAKADPSTMPASPRAALRGDPRLADLPGRAGARALALYLEKRLLAYGAPPACRDMADMPSADRVACPADRDAVMHAITAARRREATLLSKARAGLQAYVCMTARRTAEVPGAVAGAHELHAFLKRVLIVSALSDQAQRPDATALDFVPFAGSAYTLGKGLRERDAGQALRGAFGFGLDALFVWLAGATERMVARQVAQLGGEVGLGPHEPPALAMLADVGAHLDIAHPGDLPAGNVIVDPDPSGLVPMRRDALHADGASWPSGQDPAALSSRRTLSWEDALTSRQAGTSGIDAMPTAGGAAEAETQAAFRSPRWSSLKSRTAWSPLFREAAVRRTPSLTPPRVRVSRLDDAVRGTPTRQRGTGTDIGQQSGAFLSRSTVAKARAFIEAQDCIVRFGAEPNGEAMPELTEFLRIADAASDAAVRDFRQVCRALETFGRGSQTLRALLALALRERKDPTARFAVRFLAGTPPRCDLGRGLIVLPPVDAPLDVHYVDARGSTLFQRERAWLHELVHALTGIEDVAGEERIAHRGAVVYFTDRILFEAGPEVPERVMYQHAKPFFASGLPRRPDPVIEAARRDAAVTTLAEDAFLDELLRSRMKWGAVETILGVPVAQRLTVRQVAALRRQIVAQENAADGRMLPDIQPRLSDGFQIALSAGDDMQSAVTRGGKLVTAAATLYERDASFRFLFNRWYRTQMRGADWRVQRGVATHEAPMGWRIDRAQRRLVLYDEPVFYASELGPRRLESDRRLVGALVDLVTPPEQDVMLEAGRRLNRGVRVYLENRALQTLRGARQMPDAPARVSAVWSRDVSSLWQFVNKAYRAAKAEDAWLAAQGAG